RAWDLPEHFGYAPASLQQHGASVKPGLQRTRSLLFAAALFSLTPLLAAAQAPRTCGTGAPQTWIAACGAIIDDPRASAADRLRALKLRGVANYQLGQIDQAAADFSAATSLAPDDAEAWSNLGMARQAR